MLKRGNASNSLISIRQLSVLWDKGYRCVKKKVQRGRIKGVVRLTKREANDIGLQ